VVGVAFDDVNLPGFVAGAADRDLPPMVTGALSEADATRLARGSVVRGTDRHGLVVRCI